MTRERYEAIKAKDVNDLTDEDVVLLLAHHYPVIDGDSIDPPAELPIVSTDAWQQAFYLHCRLNHQTHNFAEMCALQRPPGIMGTDSHFMEGRNCGNQFEKTPFIGDYYKKLAAQAGVSTTGKFYSGALARYAGDPRAWISGLNDVKRIANEDNLGVTGSFKRQTVRGIHDTGKVGVADEIVDRHVAKQFAGQRVKKKDLPAIRQKVKESLQTKAY
jgi:hypothetical protein